MKIETVTISGLRSHRGDPPTVVDLSSKSLVAIVGPTGAGKSSILEAICFALFGEATFGGKAYAELSTDGRSEITVQMTFCVGGDRYQLVRSVAPDRKGIFGARATWLRHVDGDGNAVTHVDQVGRVNAAIRTLLGGMDRLQFCQAVLLAQNRFAELLETEERKRNELLDILLGLTALAGARKALQLTDRAVQRNEERLADRRSGLPADPAAAAAEAAERAAAIARLAEQAKRAAKIVTGLVEQATELSEEARALRTAAALMVTGRDGHALLSSLEVRLGTLAQEDTRISGQLEEAERGKEQAAQVVEEARRTLQLAEEGHGKAGSHDVALQQLAEVARRVTEHRAQQEAIARSRAELAELDGKLEAARAEISGAASELAAREQAALTAKQLAEKATEALSNREKDVASAESLADQLAQLGNGLAGALNRLARDDRKASEANQEATDKELAWRQAMEALEQAQQAASTAAAAHGHVPGDPCPVCNRELPSGWEPPISPDLNAARREEGDARRANDLAHSQREEAVRRRGQAAGIFGAAVSSLVSKATELTRAAQQRSLPLPPSLGLAEVPSEAPLAAARRAADEAASAIEMFGGWRTALGELLAPLGAAAAAAGAIAEDANGAAKQAANLVEGAAAAASKLETERVRINQSCHDAESAARSEEKRVRTLLREIPPRWSALIDDSVAEPTAVAHETCLYDKQVVAAAGKAREDAASTFDSADRRIGSLKEQKSRVVNEPLASARSELNGASQAVETLARAVEMPGPSLQPRATTPAQCLDLTRALIALAGEAGLVAGDRLQDLERRGRGLSAPAKAAVEELLRLTAHADPDGTWIEAKPTLDDPLSAATSAAIQRLVGAAGTAAGTAEGKAKRARQDVQETQELDERLGRLRAWRSDLVAAVEVLRKENFPAWARDRRIAELVDVASQILGAMTGGRYRFDSHLRICDEVAGAVRPAMTLSGGEKFEAALALALGVAEIAARSGIRFDTLFLDEGFAGLDQQNLSRALDAIEAEVEQGRRVVLITHIGAVADRLRDVLYVEPDGAGGSRVRWLDEEERFELGADLDLAAAASP